VGILTRSGIQGLVLVMDLHVCMCTCTRVYVCVCVWGGEGCWGVGMWVSEYHIRSIRHHSRLVAALELSPATPLDVLNEIVATLEY